ncbi:hypothetical protein [Clostridium thermobutyricum]|nr:hypothetical protein [Clostridium thermobutyricum]
MIKVICMIEFLNSYIDQDREPKTNRILEERCIAKDTGRVIAREITRYYPNCDRLIFYAKYSHGVEVLKFYNNSNEKAMRIEFIKDENGYRKVQTIYGSQYKVDGIDSEGYKLIKQILNKLSNDKYIDFEKVYGEF